MSSNFCTAILTFLSLWLLGLLAFAIAGTAIFLHILGAVDQATGLPIALSWLAACFSWIYLIFQSINALHIKSRRHTYPSRRSYIGLACIHLPRIQILAWIATSIIGLVIALHKPLCPAGKVQSNAAEWQAGLGCWGFRMLISLDAVMVILSLSIFCLLEINGRYMPQGLFHIGYTSSRHQAQRRTLIESPYGTDSIDRETGPHDRFRDADSSATIFADDGLQVQATDSRFEEQVKDIKEEDGTISPSPTYHTIDTEKGQVARVRHIDAILDPAKETHVDTLASNNQIFGKTPVNTSDAVDYRPATATTVTPLDIFPHDQLHKRSLSDVPNLPAKLQAHLQELEDLRNGMTIPSGIILQPNQANFGELTSSSTGRFQSSYALPQRYLSSNLSQLSRHHRQAASVTTLNNIDNTVIIANPTKSETSATCRSNKRMKSQASGGRDLERFTPAWCKEVGMQYPPLTADPAIRRLTDVWETVRRESSLVQRLSQFEFGFAGNAGRRRAETTVELERLAAMNATDMKRGNNIHLHPPYAQHNNLDDDKENIPPALRIPLNSKPLAALPIPPATPARFTTNNAHSNQNGNLNTSNHNRKIGRSKRIGTSLSLMPPLPSPPRIPERVVGHVGPQSDTSQPSLSAGSSLQHQRNGVPVGCMVGSNSTSSVGSQMGNSGRRKRGKRMVERGRYEMLPR